VPCRHQTSARDDALRNLALLGGVEFSTDTAGATDHVFGLCHLLGYRFAPRIKDLKDRKLYTVEKPGYDFEQIVW
jgi:TnpA family transposase